MAPTERADRPVVLVTGVGRRVGLGAAIAVRLAQDGWDVATSHWTPYDERVHHAHGAGPEAISDELRGAGARTLAVHADLERVETPGELFDAVQRELGP